MSLRHLLLNQLRSLLADGYDVTGISASGPDVPCVENAGVRHIAVPMTRVFSPWSDLISLWRLYRTFRREQFTIVHTHTPKPGLLGQLAARMAGVPVVINTLHGFYFHDDMKPLRRRFYVAAERIAARCSDVILSQSGEDVETAIRERICSREKIKFLGNGIDIRQFDPNRIDATRQDQLKADLGIPAGAPVIGFVGRLVKEKGVLELLAAARAVKRHVPHARFLIVGPIDTEKQDAIHPGVASDYGVEDVCIFTGKRSDMPETYSVMTMFVLPSYREGFPRSAMEASAMGKPCIVSDIRGCREAIADGQNGLLVPPRDSALLAEQILRLLARPAEAEAMGQEGRRRAEREFDEERVFSVVKSEYKRLLSLNVAPAPLV